MPRESSLGTLIRILVGLGVDKKSTEYLNVIKNMWGALEAQESLLKDTNKDILEIINANIEEATFLVKSFKYFLCVSIFLVFLRHLISIFEHKPIIVSLTSY